MTTLETMDAIEAWGRLLALNTTRWKTNNGATLICVSPRTADQFFIVNARERKFLLVVSDHDEAGVHSLWSNIANGLICPP